MVFTVLEVQKLSSPLCYLWPLQEAGCYVEMDGNHGDSPFLCGGGEGGSLPLWGDHGPW